MDRNDLLRLAGLLGDRSALEKVSGMDTQLSIERFVEFFVRDAFEANRVKLVSDLMELSAKISRTEDLKKAMREYIQSKRAEYEAQGREKAEAWFHSMSIRRRRKHVSLSYHLEY